MEKKEGLWHREVVSREAELTLYDLEQKSILAAFYLAGGTGLALRLGHRRSDDFDFFTSEAFDEEQLIHQVQQLSGFSLLGKSSHTVHAHIRETKVSFLGYPYPLLFPAGAFDRIKIADARDIACMKISAISGRGTRRDFIDLFVAAQHFGFFQLLELFKKKFAQANYSLVHVLKSLTYFEDAEKEPMPNILVDLL